MISLGVGCFLGVPSLWWESWEILLGTSTNLTLLKWISFSSDTPPPPPPPLHFLSCSSQLILPFTFRWTCGDAPCAQIRSEGERNGRGSPVIRSSWAIKLSCCPSQFCLDGWLVGWLDTTMKALFNGRCFMLMGKHHPRHIGASINIKLMCEGTPLVRGHADRVLRKEQLAHTGTNV